MFRITIITVMNAKLTEVIIQENSHWENNIVHRIDQEFNSQIKKQLHIENKNLNQAVITSNDLKLYINIVKYFKFK